MHLRAHNITQHGNLKKVDIKSYQLQAIIAMQLLYRELASPST
jgi:hypothetical protein